MALQVDASVVRSIAATLRAEPIREHWVLVGDQRFPPKQLVEAATGIPRSAYNSHQALAALRHSGFVTSDIPRPRPEPSRSTPRSETRTVIDPLELRDAFATVVDFLSDENLTTRVARLEADLHNTDRPATADLAGQSGLSPGLIQAALLVRMHTGRIDDLIHAAVITQILPLILEDGEHVVQRPSLASGNDASRKFDLETSLRIAEFKVAVWKGRDTMRSRMLTADLVHLAMADSGRIAELYVVGQRPIRFLTTSSTTVQWALGRSSPALRERFTQRYGHVDIAVRDFTAEHAQHVALRDLTKLLPVLSALDQS